MNSIRRREHEGRSLYLASLKGLARSCGGATWVVVWTFMVSGALAETYNGVGHPIRMAAGGAQQGNTTEPYPTRPLRLIVPYPAGGGVDTVARILASELTGKLGQQVVVDNRPGANGTIGSDITSKAVPDGYTMLLQSIAHAINATLYRTLPYDSIKDFSFVTTLIKQPNLLVTHPSLPANSVESLISLAKANPGKYNFASPGNGSSPHLSGELFKAMAGVNLVHVPYRGGPPAMNDLIAGRVSLYFSAISVALPIVKSGRLKALAVTGAERSAAIPDLPTIAETISGYEADSWYGVFLPAETPTRIVSRLHGDIVSSLRTQSVQGRLTLSGAVIIGDTPSQFAARVKADIAKWGELVKASGARVE